MFVQNWAALLRLGESARARVRRSVAAAQTAVDLLLRDLRNTAVPAVVHLEENERKLGWDAEILLQGLQLKVEHWLNAGDMYSPEQLGVVLEGYPASARALASRAENVLRTIARFRPVPRWGAEPRAAPPGGRRAD